MSLKKIFVLFFTILPFALGGFSSARAANSLHETFGALPFMRLVALSPDGQSLAAIRHDGDKNYLTIFALDGSGGNSAVQLAHGDIRDVIWANDDYVIVELSASDTMTTGSGIKTYEFFRYFSISKDGSSVKQLLNRSDFENWTYSGNLLSTLPDEPNYVLIDFNGKMIRAHITKGTVKVDEIGNDYTSYYELGESNYPQIRSDYWDDTNERKFYYRDVGNKKFRLFAVFPEEDGAPAKVYAHGMRDGKVIVTSRGNRDEIGIYEMSIEDGSLAPKTSRDGLDVSGVIRDPYTSRIVGASWVDDLYEQEFYDADLAKIARGVKAAFPDQHVTIDTWSRDRKKFLLTVRKPGVPSTFVYLDMSTGQTAVLGKARPDISADMIGSIEKFDYVAEDGFLVRGYVTYPATGIRQNVPLIVMPHGGPIARDSMAFDWWAQYFAAQGYAVYQPNFRGSSGYGYDYMVAGYREWGGKMQTDIYGGVQKLIDTGAVNGSRICIIGASYGGYAALYGVVKEPDMFQCAVSVNGVSDVLGILGQDMRGMRGSEISEYFTRTVGSRYSDGDYLRQISPDKNAEKIQAPILLIHGEDDIVVRSSQSKSMAKALEREGKPHELIILDGEDHWLSGAKTRVQMLEASGRFVNQNIGD